MRRKKPKRVTKAAIREVLGALAKLGGKARAAKLSPKQRSESARKAVLARWAKAKRSRPEG